MIPPFLSSQQKKHSLSPLKVSIRHAKYQNAINDQTTQQEMSMKPLFHSS